MNLQKHIKEVKRCLGDHLNVGEVVPETQTRIDVY